MLAYRFPVPAGSRGLLLAVPLLAGLGGCALPIEPVEAGLRLPVAFRMAGTAQPAATATWPSADWWRGFGSPELDALMRGAMAGNLDLAASNARLRQADALVRLAGSALLPTLDADVSAGRARSSGSSNLSVAGRASNAFGASLSASYELDFWGRNRAALQAAQSSAIAARYAIGVTALSTQAAVANAYFNALGAQEQLVIQRGNLEVASRNLGILRQRFEVGTATGLDVAQQENVLAQQRTAIPPLQQAVEASSFALGTLTGTLPGEIDLTVTPLDQLTVPRIGAGLPVEVLARRPDVQAAEADLQAASADVTVARAAMLPSFALTGSGGLRSAVLSEMLRPGSTFYNLAAGLAAPIFDGGARRAQLDQTAARREELLAAYQQAILAALQDTETRLSALQRADELVALQRARVAAAQRAYDIAEAQLRAGTVDLLSVLTTQTALFNARNGLAQAQLDRLQAAAALFTALGGGWSFATAEAALIPAASPPRTSP